MVTAMYLGIRSPNLMAPANKNKRGFRTNRTSRSRVGTMRKKDQVVTAKGNMHDYRVTSVKRIHTKSDGKVYGIAKDTEVRVKRIATDVWVEVL